MKVSQRRNSAKNWFYTVNLEQQPVLRASLWRRGGGLHWLHHWLDAGKETFCDFRHRVLRHRSRGVFEAKRVFGVAIRNSEGRDIPLRYVVEQHIKEDCGGIVPSMADWLSRIRPETWMSRGHTLPQGDPPTR